LKACQKRTEGRPAAYLKRAKRMPLALCPFARNGLAVGLFQPRSESEFLSTEILNQNAAGNWQDYCIRTYREITRKIGGLGCFKTESQKYQIYVRKY